MSTLIKNINIANAQTWDDIWANCEYSTYFHSREWAEIWKDYTNEKLRPEPVLITFSDNKTALIPLSKKILLNGLLTKYISSPAGTFGGWISKDDLSSEHINLLLNIMLKKKDIFWRINPYDKELAKHNIVPVKSDKTQVINLQTGFDHIVRKWSKGHRSAIKQAKRYGVTITKVQKQADWDEYFKIYQKSLKRWGTRATSHYKRTLFQYMSERNSPHISLFLAKYRNESIAGALCFYAKNHVVYWHGAALSEHFQLRPANLILYEAIRDACNKNLLWFDFNPSGGHKGVENFKKNFGTMSFECNIFEKMNIIITILKPMRDLYENIRRFI